MAPTRIPLQQLSHSRVYFTETPKKKNAEQAVKLQAKRRSSQYPLRKLSNMAVIRPTKRLSVDLETMKSRHAEVQADCTERTRDWKLGETLVGADEMSPTVREGTFITTIDAALALYDTTVEKARMKIGPVHELDQYTRHYHIRYKGKGKMPLVFLNETNSLFIDKIRVASHGFAYIVSPDCAGLLELGTFHLYNRPIYQETATQNREDITITRWHYCGMFRAHKTPYSLSTVGWASLPEKTKNAAVEIYCRYDMEQQGYKTESVAPRAIERCRARLAAGSAPIPLVLFENMGFSYEYARRIEVLASTQLYPVGRKSEKRNPVEAARRFR